MTDTSNHVVYPTPCGHTRVASPDGRIDVAVCFHCGAAVQSALLIDWPGPGVTEESWVPVPEDQLKQADRDWLAEARERIAAAEGTGFPIASSGLSLDVPGGMSGCSRGTPASPRREDGVGSRRCGAGRGSWRGTGRLPSPWWGGRRRRVRRLTPSSRARCPSTSSCPWAQLPPTRSANMTRVAAAARLARCHHPGADRAVTASWPMPSASPWIRHGSTTIARMTAQL